MADESIINQAIADVSGYLVTNRKSNQQPLPPRAELGWDATFSRTAAASDNPDRVGIVIRNYRWRRSLAEGEQRYDAFEQRLSQGPVVPVPAITIASDFDGPAADGAAYARKFTGKYSHRIVKGIGHNVPQEAPQEFAQAVIDVDGCKRFVAGPPAESATACERWELSL